MKVLVSSVILRQYMMVLIASSCIFASAISFAWTSPILVKLSDPQQTPLSRPITSEEGSWIVSIGFLIALFTSLPFATLLDVIGRKNCVLIIYVPKLIGALFYIFATEVWMVIFGRALISTADGYSLIIVPVYCSELAGKDHRGVLITLITVMSMLGELVTYAIGPFVSYQAFNILLTCVLLVTLIPIITFLPESPSFLYSKGFEDEALKALTYLRGSVTEAKKEIKEYKLLRDESKTRISRITLLKDKIFRKSLGLCLILNFGTQLIGFNAVTFYLQTILISTNTNMSSEISSVIVGVIQVVASFFTHAVVSSRINRKTILVFTLGLMCMGMTGLGAFFKISEPEDYVITGFMNYLPLICIIVTISSYVAGIGSLLWVVVSELFTDSGRAFGISIAITATTGVGFVAVKYFPIVTTSFGPANTYWIYSAMNVLLITLIILLFPETNGKSYREIQEALGRKFDDEAEKKEPV